MNTLNIENFDAIELANSLSRFYIDELDSIINEPKKRMEMYPETMKTLASKP